MASGSQDEGPQYFWEEIVGISAEFLSDYQSNAEFYHSLKAEKLYICDYAGRHIVQIYRKRELADSGKLSSLRQLISSEYYPIYDSYRKR